MSVANIVAMGFCDRAVETNLHDANRRDRQIARIALPEILSGVYLKLCTHHPISAFLALSINWLWNRIKSVALVSLRNQTSSRCSYHMQQVLGSTPVRLYLDRLTNELPLIRKRHLKSAALEIPIRVSVKTLFADWPLIPREDSPRFGTMDWP